MEDEKKIDPLFIELVQNALDGSKTDFQLISTNEAYTATKIFVSGTKKVIKLFKHLVQAAMETYANQIIDESTDLKVLLACMQYQQCLEFYENELKTAKSMLQEYRAYVFGGHLMKTALNIPRAEKDMVDYRTLPWHLF